MLLLIECESVKSVLRLVVMCVQHGTLECFLVSFTLPPSSDWLHRLSDVGQEGIGNSRETASVPSGGC